MKLALDALEKGGLLCEVTAANILRQAIAEPEQPARLPLTDAQINAAGRALSNASADACGIDRDDNWKTYGEEFIAEARMAIEAAHGIKPLCFGPYDPEDDHK